MNRPTTTAGGSAAPAGITQGAMALGAGPLGAGLAVLLLCVVTLACFDVSLFQSLAYVGYELGYVVVPGVVATLAITGARRLTLQEIALGIGVGYGIELLAFVVTASTGTRGFFPWFPLVVVVLAAPFVRIRTTDNAFRSASGAAWALAALMAVLLGLLTNAILDTPTPQHIYALRGYPTDMLWSTSITAEAMHHWPLQVPGYAGQPLYYHYFGYLHLAGAAHVTGLSPWLLNFRFFPLWALLVAAFELYVLARAISGQRIAGLIAAFLLLVAGDFLPWTGLSQQIIKATYISLTFAYGTLIWIPLLLALWLSMARRDTGYRRGAIRFLALVLVVVAAGAKAPIVIVAAGGLGITALWALLADRQLFPRVAAATGAVLAVVVIAWNILYRTTNNSGVALKPFGMIKVYEPFVLIARHVPGALLWLFWLVAACVIAIKVLAAMLPGIAASVRWSNRRDLALLAGPFVAGILLYFAFTNLGNSENYFLWYGEVPAAALAGIGLAEVLARFVRPTSIRPVVVVIAVCALLVAWAVESPSDPTPKPVWENINAKGPMTAEYLGFRWIAAHTSVDAVLAVDARSYPLSCFQTAFAERRAIIDCTFGFAPEVSVESVSGLKGVVSSTTFRDIAQRVRLNDAIFDADPAALRTGYRRFGLRYVVVDLASGGTAKEAARLAHHATQVFRNSSVAVFRVSP